MYSFCLPLPSPVVLIATPFFHFYNRTKHTESPISKEEVTLLQSMPALILEAINAIDGDNGTHEDSLNKGPNGDSKRSITDNLLNVKQTQKNKPYQQEVGDESHSDNQTDSEVNLNKKVAKMGTKRTKDDMDKFV